MCDSVEFVLHVMNIGITDSSQKFVVLHAYADHIYGKLYGTSNKISEQRFEEIVHMSYEKSFTISICVSQIEGIVFSIV